MPGKQDSVYAKRGRVRSALFILSRVCYRRELSNAYIFSNFPLIPVHSNINIHFFGVSNPDDLSFISSSTLILHNIQEWRGWWKFMFLKVSRDRKRINVYLPTETETTALFSWKKLDYMMITKQGCTIL